MQINRKLWVLVLVPPVLAGLMGLAHVAIQALVLGRCDAKFGCAGSVQIAALIGALALLPSWLGFAAGAFPHRAALERMAPKWRVLLVAVLGALHAAMFHTFHEWPVDSTSAVILVWAIAAAAACWVAIAGVRRWAAGNPFKPDGVRPSA